MDSNFSKYKYLLGQPAFPGKDNQFTNISMPDQSIEGNTICANSKYIAVSCFFVLIFYSSPGNSQVDAWLCMEPKTSQSSLLNCPSSLATNSQSKILISHPSTKTASLQHPLMAP